MRISDWSSDVCSSDLDHQYQIFGCGTQRQDTVHAYTHVLGRMVDQRLCCQYVLDIGRAYAKTQRTQGTIGSGVAIAADRSEERRVGKECVSTCRSRWSPSP